MAEACTSPDKHSTAAQLVEWLKTAHIRLSELQEQAVTSPRHEADTPEGQAKRQRFQKEIGKLNTEIDLTQRKLTKLKAVVHEETIRELSEQLAEAKAQLAGCAQGTASLTNVTAERDQLRAERDKLRAELADCEQTMRLVTSGEDAAIEKLLELESEACWPDIRKVIQTLRSRRGILVNNCTATVLPRSPVTRTELLKRQLDDQAREMAQLQALLPKP